MVSPIRPAHCPPLEEIAALIDGRLSGADRARVVAHVADCADCYAVLAGTVDFLDHHDEGSVEDEGEGHPSKSHAALVLLSPPPETEELPPTESILPVRPGNPRTKKFRDWGWMLRLAAAVVVGVGAGALVYPLLKVREPELNVAELLAGTSPSEGVPSWTAVTANRGWANGEEMAEALVLLGADIADLHFTAQQGDAQALDQVFGSIEKQGREAMLDEPQLETIRALKTTRQAVTQDELLSGVRELDKAIRRELLKVDLATDYSFGKWAEAGRLAAESGNTSHFAKGSPSRQFLSWLLKQLDRPNSELLRPAAADHVRSIRDLLQGESPDIEALASHFDAILRAYTPLGP